MTIAAEKPLRFVRAKDMRRNTAPPIYAVLYVACIMFAGMGDWKQINGSFGMYLKAATLGPVGLALIWFFLEGNIKRLKTIGKFFVLFTAPLLFTFSISMFIWIVNAEGMSAISRGTSKLFFQMFTVFAVLSGAYMFGSKALYYTFYGLVGANGLMAGLEMMKYGIGSSIQSVINCVLSNGTAIGFMRAMEIHDITFAMGLYAIYFVLIDMSKRKEFFIHLGLALIFFVLGFKRIAFASMAASIAACLLLRKFAPKRQRKIIYAVNLTLIVFSFLYVCSIKSGLFLQFTKAAGIDMMGRDKIYTYMNTFYEIDTGYLGYGFEYTVALLRGMKQEGIQVINITGVHNDILKQFIELGFWGFFIWMFITFLAQPLWYTTKYGEKAGGLLLSTTLYTFVTYMTDNTIYYFWLSLTIRVMLISYAMSWQTAQEAKKKTRDTGVLSQTDAEMLEQGERIIP